MEESEMSEFPLKFYIKEWFKPLFKCDFRRQAPESGHVFKTGQRHR